MNRKWSFLLIVLSVVAALFLLAGCRGVQGEEGLVGPAGATGPIGPIGPAGSDATASQEYVGSEQCGECHETEYATFVLSGHPYKLTKIEDGKRPLFPYDTITGGVTDPPEGYSWNDISYLIGGFGWKARFVDQNGYIITGDENATTQYNFANDFVDKPAEWVAYHPGEEKPYDCGVCHTTGYRPQGHQDGLEGIIGTWEAPGVQCEACHGPGSRHSGDPYGVRMVLDRTSQACGECHVRNNPAVIDASNGFEQHHEQFEDMYSSKHFAIACVTCHDPHASAKFADEDVNPNQGIVQVCESCHWENARQKTSKHGRVDCIDCHMPPMGKSAQANAELFRGDIRSHQFSINPDPEAPQFSEDGSVVMPYLTLQYACRQCHNGETGSALDSDRLAEEANGYHDRPTPTPEPILEPTPELTATEVPSGG